MFTDEFRRAVPENQSIGDPGTALDYVIETYPRDPERLTACIEILLSAGAHTRYDVPGALAILRGRLLTLRGATLLHVAAEYGFFDAARLLLDRGAEVNARADIDANGVGGQTPIFHASTHCNGVNPEVAQLLIARGADLTIRARVPGHHKRPDEVLDVSGGEYCAIFPLR